MILVVGATGRLGGDITRRFHALGYPVRALVRASSDPEKVSALKALGIECVSGDLCDPASLTAACQGVETVVTTATAMASPDPADTIERIDAQGQRSLVAAAQAAGVQHFIYISYSKTIDMYDPCPLSLAKREMENRVVSSGMAYTILRPSYFMESWLSPALGFDYGNGRVSLFGDGDSPVSWISLYDVARFAIMSVEHPRAKNVVLELGGPQALTQREVVRIFENLSGKSYELVRVPTNELEARRKTAAAAGDSRAESRAALQMNLVRGNVIDMDPVLSLFPQPLTSVEDYALRVLGEIREQQHEHEILRQLQELTSFLVDAIGSGRFGFDAAIGRYVEQNNNDLSHALSEFVRRMGALPPPGEVEDYTAAEAVRREVLRGLARQFPIPEMDRFAEKLIRSQDERISLYRTLVELAESLNKRRGDTETR
jgi:uncharacterized protein YbjT (DUF2867 family)